MVCAAVCTLVDKFGGDLQLLFIYLLNTFFSKIKKGLLMTAKFFSTFISLQIKLHIRI